MISYMYKLDRYIQKNIKENNNNFNGFPKIFENIFYDEICVDDDIDNKSDISDIGNIKVLEFPIIEEFIVSNQDDLSFQELLFKYIDNKNLKDSDVYNKVHIDRRLFSKIRSDKNYHPSKETIILLAIGLELSEDELELLLSSASYSLPKNNYFDLIIRFCFINKIYKITAINDMLSKYDCKLFYY